MKRVDLESKDLVAERIEQLKALFPEVATEGDGSIDFEKLRLLLGEEVNVDDERYAFTWPGKLDAIRQSQTVSTATLRPCVEKSRGRDGTDGSFDSDNLYIEGDNLEVLKLLQRSYHGKVKMIYIDPPYNTGHDFVYKDKFGDTIANYKEQTGLTNQSNPDTSGRYHSDWCSMMYPRLKLARELLSDDGVIFISIDDNEQKNLIEICNEVFGESNFVSEMIWEKKFSPQNDDKYITSVHDYILVYAKNKLLWSPNKLNRSKDELSKFKNPDGDTRGLWTSGDLTSKTKAKGHSYKIVSPTGKVFLPPSGRQWAPAYETFLRLQEEGRLWFGKDGNNIPRQKQFLNELEGIVPTSILLHSKVGHNQEAKKELKTIFDEKDLFDTPKPVRLLKYLLTIGSTHDCIVMDFFSGASSFAHATIEKNMEDNGNRKVVLVQMPESCKNNQLAIDYGYHTVSQIGEERIRRAGDKIKAVTWTPLSGR